MRTVYIISLCFAIGCSAPGSIMHGPGGSGGSGGSGVGGGGGNGGSGGGGGSGGSGGSGGTGGSGGGNMDCPPSAKLVYIIDSNGQLSSFAPNQKDVTQSIITDLGKLSCPSKNGGQPFSMSVDRSGTAWVEYIKQDPVCGTFQGGEMFTVPTTNVAGCSATTYMSGQHGFEEFGMGFVADAAMSSAETLFIAGGKGADCINMSPAASLGTYSTATQTITAGMGINGRPELTGTGDAKLWGFFPDAQNPRVSQLDKSAGTESATIMLPMLQGTPHAWAFAFWGGDFWIFLMKDNEMATTVYHVVGTTGAVTSWPLSGRTIVGAGVSTCAPTSPIS